jgi:methane monooxygenase component C
MYAIEATAEDGRSVRFDCSPNEDVISASLRNSVFLLASCREGGCATCKAECVDGEYEIFNATVQALPPEEEEEGMVLLCRTYPRSDLSLKLPYTYDRISFAKSQTDWEGKITVCEVVSSNVCRLVVQCFDQDSGQPVAMPFLPGQFVDIEIPEAGIKRSYSMANRPGTTELEFFIRLLGDGQFSAFLINKAKAGMSVHLHGPSGAFGMHENGLRPRYFVAGGTGLSPLLSMVRSMISTNEPHPMRLFVGVTKEEELFFQHEFDHLCKQMPGLRTGVSVMQPTNGWAGFQGTVVDHVRHELRSSGERPDLYVCGPPKMIDAMIDAAVQSGVPKDRIYLEKFLPS